MKPVHSLSGAGLGLRREHLQSLAREVPSSVQFLEVAPENWIKAPKQRRQLLEQILDQTPLVCHGLSLSLGGADTVGYESAAGDQGISTGAPGDSLYRAPEAVQQQFT